MNAKRVIQIIIAGILIGVAICTLPIKQNINKTITAVQWRIYDEKTTKNLKITIHGWYRNYLFRKDTFKGDILIEGYDCTYTSKPLNITFEDGRGNLVYTHYNLEKNNVENSIDTNNLGVIMCSPDFNDVLICVFLPTGPDELSWDTKYGTVISGNAKELSEAKEIAGRLFEKNSFVPEENPFSSDKSK